MRDADGTDGRLDDLNERVGEIARRMDEGFSRLDRKIDGLDSKTDVRIENLRTEMRTEFQALHRLILGFGGALVTVVLADTIVGRL